MRFDAWVDFRQGVNMLWTIAVILFVLWFLGMVTAHTIGGFIHLLLILAIIAVLIRIIQGRSPI
jgi:hypothetical protein